MRWRGLLAFLASASLGCAASREVYVWQRQFTPEVTAALRQVEPQLSGCCVLAAEISWPAGRLRVLRLNPDFKALATLGKPVGLALRVGAFPGPFAADDDTARALGDIAVEMIGQARAAGLAASEFQVDFDAAESKLAGYATWLQALRRRIAPTPLVFTALPVWLKRDTFRNLARAADGFVLQVHALDRPAGPDTLQPLCDPVRAQEWTRRAGESGVPFRVALPTYGYVVGFSPEGKFLGLAAEGPRPAWPPGTHMRVVRAEATEMARLAQAIETTAPSACKGVIWFRLPVGGDRLNWDPATFATVLRGAVPEKKMTVEVAWSDGGLAEIVVVNLGQTTEPLPQTVSVRWPEAVRLLAADGLSGFRLDARGAEGQANIVARAVPPDAFVAPGRRTKIAWLRFSHELSLDVGLPASPSSR